MATRHAKTKTPAPAPEAEPTQPTPEAEAIEAAALAEIDDQIEKRRSVVAVGYKRLYRNRALEAGRLGKAPKRSCDDWLARELAKVVLDDKERLVVSRLEAVLDENGVAHRNWNRVTPGWQGRLRMSGRMALQRIVAQRGALLLDGESREAPEAWVAKHRN
jgi:hypothetical protein